MLAGTLSLLIALFSISVSGLPHLPTFPAEGSPGPSDTGNPEMLQLAGALAGDWDTVELMEQGDFFPKGSSRRGQVHARLAAGGNALVYEVHSDGSAGNLDGFHTIWWDRAAKQYFFFACFNSAEHPCRPRGTAHWDGATFVNEYEEKADGKTSQWRDSFSFTATTHTLTAAVRTADGSWRTVITTKATRR